MPEQARASVAAGCAPSDRGTPRPRDHAQSHATGRIQRHQGLYAIHIHDAHVVATLIHLGPTDHKIEFVAFPISDRRMDGRQGVRLKHSTSTRQCMDRQEVAAPDVSWIAPQAADDVPDAPQALPCQPRAGWQNLDNGDNDVAVLLEQTNRASRTRRDKNAIIGFRHPVDHVLEGVRPQTSFYPHDGQGDRLSAFQAECQACYGLAIHVDGHLQASLPVDQSWPICLPSECVHGRIKVDDGSLCLQALVKQCACGGTATTRRNVQDFAGADGCKRHLPCTAMQQGHAIADQRDAPATRCVGEADLAILKCNARCQRLGAAAQS